MRKLKSLIVVALLAFASHANASLEVGPLATIHTTGQKASVLHIKNARTTEQRVEISVFEVVVENGVAKQVPTTDLFFRPSVMTLQPGQKQTVRAMHTYKGNSEKVYRVNVEEIPSPNGFEGKSAAFNVNYYFIADFPWIWRPVGAEPVLSAEKDGSGVYVVNTGNATAQLVGTVAPNQNTPGLIGYVHPGERFKLAGVPTTTQTLTFKANGKDIVLGVK